MERTMVTTPNKEGIDKYKTLLEKMNCSASEQMMDFCRLLPLNGLFLQGRRVEQLSGACTQPPPQKMYGKGFHEPTHVSQGPTESP